jgi:hypothetical protein
MLNVFSFGINTYPASQLPDIFCSLSHPSSSTFVFLPLPSFIIVDSLLQYEETLLFTSSTVLLNGPSRLIVYHRNTRFQQAANMSAKVVRNVIYTHLNERDYHGHIHQQYSKLLPSRSGRDQY